MLVRKGAVILSDLQRMSYAITGDLYRRAFEIAGYELTERQTPMTVDEREREKKLCEGRVVIHNTIGPDFAPLENSYNIAHPFHEWSRYPAKWVTNLNLFDEVWVTSEHIAELLKDSGVTKPVHWLPPALDLIATPLKGGCEISNGPFRFLSIGEAHFRKGFHLLMEGFQLAFPERGRATLDIFTAPDCRWESPRPGITIHKERMTPEKTRTLYAQYDAYVTASLGEGLGLPVAESILAGLPMIANYWGGHTSLLCDGGFWPIPHKEIDQPFCSDPSYYAQGQQCAFSDPGDIAATLKDVASSTAYKRSTRSDIARAHLLANYGTEITAKRIRDRLLSIG